MTWTTPLHSFKCGACGITVTSIVLYEQLLETMRVHSELCPARASRSEAESAQPSGSGVVGVGEAGS